MLLTALNEQWTAKQANSAFMSFFYTLICKSVTSVPENKQYEKAYYTGLLL
jgi:hypothetical protein